MRKAIKLLYSDKNGITGERTVCIFDTLEGSNTKDAYTVFEVLSKSFPKNTFAVKNLEEEVKPKDINKMLIPEIIEHLVEKGDKLFDFVERHSPPGTDYIDAVHTFKKALKNYKEEEL